MPQSSKSRAFLVASVNRSTCAVAAMSMSAWVRETPRAARVPRSRPAAAAISTVTGRISQCSLRKASNQACTRALGFRARPK